MREALLALLRLNLVAAVAVVLVMALRWPVRRLFGPRIAYGLWSLPPLAVAAMLTPARTIFLPRPDPGALPAAAGRLVVAHPGFAPTLRLEAAPNLTAALAVLWLAGAVATALWFVWHQARFDRAARQGLAGPAVVGVVAPRVVMPADFACRYTPREQRIVLAHEDTHIRRQDSRINALVALARCANWFNPAVHLMARSLRLDQEFACDAQVIARQPRARRVYGEAMLKAHLAARPLPLGCHWPPERGHPLVERIRLLSRPQPDALRRATGLVFVALVAVGGAAAVWANRPARVRFTPSHEAMILAQALRGAPPLPGRPTRAATPAPAKLAKLARAVLVPIPLQEAPAPAALDLRPVDLPVEPAPLEPLRRQNRIPGAAGWSAVSPGTAVRVLATMLDPEGRQLTTDLTAFGSQSLYRVGYVERSGSRLKLFTSVVQHGDRYLVTAAPNGGFRPDASASIDLASGESGVIRLPQGLEVDVHVLARSETPEESVAARILGPRRFVSVEQFRSTL